MCLFDKLRKSDNRKDHAVKIADIHTNGDGVPFVAFSIYYRSNYNGPSSNSLFVYNPIENKVFIFKNAHKENICDIRFLPNTLVCSAANDGTICLVDPIKKQTLYTVSCGAKGFSTTQHIVELFPSPCGRYIVNIDILGY